eukprot:CAMPEP_0172446000 /NCGR_PEP_ID=MMETSP1065-20121228/5715_1 /TAXON_ID=265537 /ORGANISM="Amphiprora paludosa, Strain CCMP125" /LENGTH=306 /DNA_ID=CAMNT_0013197017 /DNA_START=72 /DNA_END=992 /DNA_ORIENTATION=-
MAKKKGGAAAQESKKSLQKKKQQLVEDKTFGLKNKNKSKKVQQQVESMTKNVMNSGDPKMRKLEEQRARAKSERKAKAKAAKDEQEALFGAALLAVQKKATTNKKEGKVEAQGRDGNDDSNKKSTSRAMKMMFQMDAKEMSEKLKEDPNYVPTLEDQIEDQRQKKVAELKASGQTGTKITPETFAAWRERKIQRRAAESRKKVEAEMKKKKGGKGLSVLSGRDLYEYKKDLFKDQEDGEGEAIDTKSPNNLDEDNGDNKQSAKATGGGDGDADADADATVEKIAEKIQSDLFLEGDDDDLDDLDDD